MAKFIKTGDMIINVEDIRRIEFISDDIYTGLFPQEDGELLVDYIPFTYAKMYLFDGQSVDLSIILYTPEDDEDTDTWRRINMAHIAENMANISETIGGVIAINNF